MKSDSPKLVLSVCALMIVSHVNASAESRSEIERAGIERSETKSFDREVQEFIEKHHVPGMSVAVTVDGQLKYARAFGYADVEKKDPVLPTSLFRIASLSKPITAVAVLQLVEQNKLSLDDKLYDVLDQYEDKIASAGKKFDLRSRDITIRHLLQHRGGWDRNASFDAMFQSVRFARQLGQPAPATAEQVIEAMLSQKLDFNPGERYAYSNFGYCLLGRVIEKLTKQTYEKYVQESVLAPLGINSMKIGKTLLDRRSLSEVRYYHNDLANSVFQKNLGQKVPSPYGGWYLEAMDAHGAWIASAVDLARFASAFDNPEHCPILSKASIQEMYSRPPGQAGYTNDNQPKVVYYSHGWSNRVLGNGKKNHWHTGSLPGTATIMIRRHDGKNFVALLNTRQTPSSDSLQGDLDKLLHRAANGVKVWPQENFFSHFSK